MDYLIFVNPISGKGKSLALASQLKAKLETLGFSCSLEFTQAGKKTFPENFNLPKKALIIFGGDGSLHKFVNQVELKDNLPISFFATGTANLLSKELNLPKNIDDFAQMLVKGQRIALPILKIEGNKCLMFYEAGFIAKIVVLVNRWRDINKRHGLIEFVAASLKVLRKNSQRNYHLHIFENETRQDLGCFSNILVTRIRRYSLFGRVPVRSQQNDPISQQSFAIIAIKTTNRYLQALILILINLRILNIIYPLFEFLDCVYVMRVDQAEIEDINQFGAFYHIDSETAKFKQKQSIGFIDQKLWVIVA